MMRVNRQIKKTILMVGEGPTERAFLQYIKELYHIPYDDRYIKVEQAGGGSPDCVVWRAVHLCKNRAYDQRYVLIDKFPEFTPDPDLQNAMNLEPKIQMLFSIPCIEGLFLEILEHKGFSKASWNSEKCKSEFEKNYMSYDKKVMKEVYAKHFSKEFLEKRRIKVLELDKILAVFA